MSVNLNDLVLGQTLQRILEDSYWIRPILFTENSLRTILGPRTIREIDVNSVN